VQAGRLFFHPSGVLRDKSGSGTRGDGTVSDTPLQTRWGQARRCQTRWSARPPVSDALVSDALVSGTLVSGTLVSGTPAGVRHARRGQARPPGSDARGGGAGSDTRGGGGGRPLCGLETGGRTTRTSVCRPPFRERRAPLLLMMPALRWRFLSDNAEVPLACKRNRPCRGQRRPLSNNTH
jgi:hypothetical protein